MLSNLTAGALSAVICAVYCRCSRFSVSHLAAGALSTVIGCMIGAAGKVLSHLAVGALCAVIGALSVGSVCLTWLQEPQHSDRCSIGAVGSVYLAWMQEP